MNPVFPPIRIDLFAIFILLGFVQGIILSYFFLTHYKGGRLPNLFLGIMMLGMSVIMFDVWLGYTNYMFHVLWLVDFTEPLNLLLFPVAYLYIKTGISNRIDRSAWLHTIPFFLYLLYMCLLVYPQNEAFKYNSNIGAFHPEMDELDSGYYGEKWMFFLKWHINDLTFVSLVAYSIAIYVFLRSTFKEKGLAFFSLGQNPLAWYRNMYFKLLAFMIIYTVVRLSFRHDLGDHIVSAFLSLIVYATSFTVLRRSLFFQETAMRPAPKKYEKSSLTDEIQSATLKKLEEIMTKDRPFLDPGFSMPVLAKKLGISTHHLSQILNEELGQSFFDFLASYRIREAQKLLSDEGSSFIKIEEIAQMVGYNSKSAFNTAFRKITGSTPSEFKKNSVK
jgi:AraC-like DNA-binding protein